jgi:dihydroorotate dehydrogenase (fumarate)
VAGLELNFYSVPRSFHLTGTDIELRQLNVLKEVKKSLKIPVAVKLSPFYTNAANVVQNLDQAGADGFVLFNTLFQPDIDIESEKHHFPYNLSHESDSRLPLRYAGILYGNIKADICSNTGIHKGEDVVKMLLAGATSVQVVSTLYKNGIGYIATILKDIEEWMSAKNYQKPDDFIGKLAKKNVKDPFAYKRAQYVDILMRSEEIFKKYPMV